MPDAPTIDWTCERCRVTVSWRADVKSPEMPASWSNEGGELHCLNCRRDLAGEAGLAGLADDAPAADRQKLHSHARVEFEIKREPDRPDNQIAQVCHTSVISVRKARERIGIPRTD
jgi:hypothetical protein